MDSSNPLNKNKPKELNRTQDEYRILFEESPCYITVQDRDLKLLKYNREFETMFSPEPGDYCFRAYKGRSERCPACPVIKTLEDGQPHVSEERAVTKDGTETFWLVKTSPIKNAQGEVIAAMEMSLDLTHLKFLEKEAKKSEEKYRTIFDTIPNPVFVLDAETLNILDCNNNVTRVYGFGKQELLNRSFLDLFQGEDRNAMALQIKTSNFINRAKQVRKDGHVIYVRIRMASSEYSGQNVILLTASDITIQLVAEQQLIQASKMATLGEMATGIAHELNQPLSVIKTASSFIRRKMAKKDAIDHETLGTLAEEMDSHVDRAEKIINHMREFGRKSEVAKEKVQVNQVLKRALDFFKQQLKLREIEVTEQMEENLPIILADPNRLEQVFVNLLINARDAIEKKGEQGKPRDAHGSILLQTKVEQGLVTVKVTDNGTGIPEAIREKIFEPFFTTKNVGKGTGLGLSISYGIVRDYEGTIRVDGKEGEGATFTVQFPVPEEAE
jgi:histidine kinase